MNKKELIKKIAEGNQISITKMETFYKNFEQILIEAITSNEEVILSSSIGRFVLSTSSQRIMPEIKFTINKKTGKRSAKKTSRMITYPPITVVKFKISDALKQKVKNLQLK
jgi:DNA-binding protein HU-beta